MDIHKNARLTAHGRERIVRQVLSGQTPAAARGPSANGWRDIAPKAWRAFRTAARGHTGCIVQRRLRPVPRLKRCAASA